ncbi:MAG: NADH:flavin oxidoreductase/NADH oxidase family protein [Gammaproteobacteria bacterium]|nr:NADH:flavin oxidoreductase/NADH oxidase family protein [Gammaproteobacteria bacterium]
MIALYRRWSAGGAGLLVTGNIMIDARYLERPGNIVIDNNGGESALRALADAGTHAGNHLWMQISHPGRQCSRIVNNRPVAPSPVQLKILGNFAQPRELSHAEINNVVANYARVARIARETGFTGVQIHAAHGYLISQFLSPLTNRRNDDWGGDPVRRARFLLHIVRAVRASVGNDYPVAVKLNSADFQKGGFTLTDSCQVAGWLQQEKIDLLEISGGTYEQPRLLGYHGDPANELEPVRQSTQRREAYFLEYAQAIRKSTNTPLAVTGGIRDAKFMNEAITNGELDVVGLARPLCVEPELPDRLLNESALVARRDELNLRLGTGLFGPGSSVGLFRALNTQGGVAWYYRQIIRLSEGREPDTTLNLRSALYRHIRDEYRAGFARRKAMRNANG